MKKAQQPKHYFLPFLFVCLLTALLFAGCGQKNTTYDGIDMGKSLGFPVDIMGVRYKLYSNGYAEIICVLNTYGQLTETVSYEGKDYSVVKISWDSNGNGLFNTVYPTVAAPEHLVMPDTLIELPSYVFTNCGSSTITLPSNLKYLSIRAFDGCINIETVEFPDSLEKIAPEGLFAGCTNLKYIDLPKDITYILNTSYMFSGCSSLESVTIPGACKILGQNTFHMCDVLSDITLGDGLTDVYEDAFDTLPALEEVVFPDSITTLRDRTFCNCPNLKDVWLPDNISDVPAHMFKESLFGEDADSSGITIHVKSSLVEYVQNLYPDATVVAK